MGDLQLTFRKEIIMKVSQGSIDSYINSIKILLNEFHNLKDNEIETKMYLQNGSILNIDEIIEEFEGYLIEAMSFSPIY